MAANTKTRQNVTVGSGGTTWPGWRHKRLLIICVGIVVIVAVIIAVGLYRKSHPYINKQQSVTYQALGLSLRGHNANAQRLLSQQIAQTTDKTKQGQYYEQKAGIAYGDNDYSEALKFARQAESLHPTANSASWIAQSAEKLKQAKLAAEYYQKELDRSGKPITPSDKANLASIAQKIKTLEAAK